MEWAREEERNKGTIKEPENHFKMATESPYLLIVTLNVNELVSLIKDRVD